MRKLHCFICDTCKVIIEIHKVPDYLQYSPHFCSWKCALRSGRDLTLDGKHLACLAYVGERLICPN